MSLTRATSRVIDPNLSYNTQFTIRSTVSSTTLHPDRAGLIISAEGSDVGGRIGLRCSSAAENPVFTGYRSRGTLAAPTAVLDNDILSTYIAIGYDGTGWSDGDRSPMMRMYASENWTATNKGSYISFLTVPNRQQITTERMRITDRGNVVIGAPSITHPTLSSARLSLNTFDGVGALTADHLAFGNGLLQYPIPINYSQVASIVGKAATSDYRLHVQDGTGRVNQYWNAYTTYVRSPTATEQINHVYTVTNEGAARQYMGTNYSGDGSGEFHWYSAPMGTAGNTITWKQLGVLQGSDTEFSGCWFSPRGIYSDFFISGHATGGRAGRVGINTHLPEETLDVSGTLHLRGGTAQYNPGGVIQAANLTNAYISFGHAGSVNDWCYLRQTGGENNYVLSFDLHDDGNFNPGGQAFAIRNIGSAGVGVDTIQTNFFINNLGNVGLGTTLPARKLHLAAPTATEMIIEQTDGLADNRRWNFVADAGNLTTATNFYLRKLNDAGTGGYIAWAVNGASGNLTVGGAVAFNAGRLAVKQGAENYDTGGISVIGSNTNNRWTMLAATIGHLYFGYNASDRGFISNVNGSYNAVSDGRYKKNIVDTTFGLKDITKLRPVEYHMIDEDDTNKKHLGFIAQEVKDVIDNVVEDAGSATGESKYFISMTEMVPVLVKAIQELNTLVQTQSATIVNLENRVASLESQINN